jgi:hypothetical protein
LSDCIARIGELQVGLWLARKLNNANLGRLKLVRYRIEFEALDKFARKPGLGGPVTVVHGAGRIEQQQEIGFGSTLDIAARFRHDSGARSWLPRLKIWIE